MPGKLVLPRVVVVVVGVLLPLFSMPQEALNRRQKKLLDHLLSLWSQDGNIASISLGMRDLEDEDFGGDDRYALGMFLRANPEIHPVVSLRGWETVTLDAHEKAIARLLADAHRRSRSAPTREQLAAALEMEPTAIDSGLRMLEWFGIIRADAAAGGAGYRMAGERYVHWEQRDNIRFTSYRIRMENSVQRDVDCLDRIFEMARGEWKSESLALTTSSHSSGRPIQIRFVRGKVEQTSPAGVLLFAGGGCRFTLPFASAEELKEWKAHQPAPPTGQALPPQAFLTAMERKP